MISSLENLFFTDDNDDIEPSSPIVFAKRKNFYGEGTVVYFFPFFICFDAIFSCHNVKNSGSEIQITSGVRSEYLIQSNSPSEKTDDNIINGEGKYTFHSEEPITAMMSYRSKDDEPINVEMREIPHKVMLNQILNTKDITATLNLAPRTKKLMACKKMNAANLLSLPSRIPQAEKLLQKYERQPVHQEMVDFSRLELF